MAKGKSRRSNTGTPIFEVWSKYEEVAMHFNDLLLKIRTQALGVVAALSTIVGIFAKTTDVKLSWEMATGAFLILSIFWIAIWTIDFRYYNRLLIGAVLAITSIEEESKTKTRIKRLNLSQEIERAARNDLTKDEKKISSEVSGGRWWFYILVFCALMIGLTVCSYEMLTSHPNLPCR